MLCLKLPGTVNAIESSPGRLASSPEIFHAYSRH
jgi:hypothetical protein